jgi:hypothetical protein
VVRHPKYAFNTYCSSIRCVLKNDPLMAMAERIIWMKRSRRMSWRGYAP